MQTTSFTMATTTTAPPSQKAREHFRGRFEAWNAQIQILKREIPARWRRSKAMRLLVEHHEHLRDRIRAVSGGKREERELEREWSQLKYAWLRAIEAVNLDR